MGVSNSSSDSEQADCLTPFQAAVVAQLDSLVRSLPPGRQRLLAQHLKERSDEERREETRQEACKQRRNEG